VKVVALWLAAALISGFTLRRYLGPLDEGILMQAASRMADGEWPWRDFSWAYGPAEPLYVMAMGKLFDPSLLWWRLLRVAADATAAVLVWALARDAGPRWALAAWAAAAVTAAQPTSANPTAPALALGLGAVLLGTKRQPGWAGAAAGAAAFWRPDVGAAAALAAAAAAFVAARGSAAAGGANLHGVRPRSDEYEAGARGAAAAALTVLAAAAAVVAVLYAPFVVAAGPAAVWDALVVQATRDGEWWRLPFPDWFPGGDVKDFLTWALPYVALVVLALSVRRPLVILAAGAALYFVSRADLEHAQGLLVVTAALAALVRPRWVGVAALSLLILVGAANRASALLRPPDLVAYKQVRVPPQEARALVQVQRLVDELVPPGEPIYAAPLRSDLVSFSNPLLHYLVDRPNVLQRDVLLQAKPEEQRRIIAKLPRAKVVVRWLNPESAKPEPNRRGRPSGSRALDDYIDDNYARRARFGDYEVLVSRSMARP
jgi:hypothetical protein